MDRCLAFESVTRSGSACVVEADGSVVAETAIAEGRAAAELPRVLHRLLVDHGPVTRLAVAVGPGSFTGLRVAVVAARTLGWTENLPVHPVCTLRAIAGRAGDGRHLVLMPLKRDTTFHAAFAVAGDRCEPLAPVTATLDAQQPAWGPDLADATVIGPAVAAKPDLVARWAAGRPIGDAWGCDARAVARAAATSEPCRWDRLAVAYRIASAPELQRRGEGAA